MTETDCEEIFSLLPLLAGGELSPDEAQQVETHAARCPRCTDALAHLAKLRSRLKAAGPHVPPPGLARRLGAALDLEDRTAFPTPAARSRRRYTLLAASHLLAAILPAALVYGLLAGRPPDGSAPREIVTAHVRAVLASQLVQVASGDTHTVKPWLSARLPFSPDVRDFKAEGFPLLGGRVEYLFGRPAAVLVYARRAHVISLFVLPADQAGDGTAGFPSAGAEWRGYHMGTWRDASFVYIAASDLNRPEFREFIRLAGARLSEVGPPPRPEPDAP